VGLDPEGIPYGINPGGWGISHGKYSGEMGYILIRNILIRIPQRN
jgi:hypothetical protein